MSLMELEFGIKKKYILAKYGDECNHCLDKKAQIYFEGGNQTTFVLCIDCALAWVRILVQDLISAQYPDVRRKMLVDIGVADEFLESFSRDIKQAMSGEG